MFDALSPVASGFEEPFDDGRETGSRIVIISHQHRFVFVKTRKTAGTSIEVLLERIAGEDAIVTPIEPPVAGHLPRNYAQVDGRTSARERRARRKLVDDRMDLRYFNHISAAVIREQLGRRRWRSYFTFCFERNPWDKTVSTYFFRKSVGQLDTGFRDYVLRDNLPSDFDLYSLDGHSVGVDFVGRFEHLEDDLRSVLDHLGLGADVALSREKSDSRPADATVASLFDREMSARVEGAFAREIRTFGYRNPASTEAGPTNDRLPDSN
jgi:hypothetical protein